MPYTKMSETDPQQLAQPDLSDFVKEEPIGPEQYENDVYNAGMTNTCEGVAHEGGLIHSTISDCGADNPRKEHHVAFGQNPPCSNTEPEMATAGLEWVSDSIKMELCLSPLPANSSLEESPETLEIQQSGQCSNSCGKAGCDRPEQFPIMDDTYMPPYLGTRTDSMTYHGIDSSRRRNMHFADNPLRCKHCDEMFVSKKDLVCHERDHLGLKPYKCEHCDKIFSGVGGLNRHLRIHTGEKPFKCEYCEKAFALKGNLVKHYENIHIGEKSFKCSYCEKTFKQSSHLTAHLRIHTGERPYSCQYCGRAFSSHSNLTAHERTHTGERPYSCDVCQKTFKRNTDLRRHQSVHTGDTPFVCRYCNKSVLCQRTLTNHEALHFREKVDHNCEICARTFSNSYLLKKHARMHLTSYECQFCGKVFARSSHLQSHERIHTGEKPYSCKHCGQVFSAPSNLIAHERIHTGEKPFKCKLCNKAFTAQSNLIAHEQTHSETKPFKCNLCDKCFKQSSKLKKHITKHHPDALPLKIASGPIPANPSIESNLANHVPEQCNSQQDTNPTSEALDSEQNAGSKCDNKPMSKVDDSNSLESNSEKNLSCISEGMFIKEEPVDYSDDVIDNVGQVDNTDGHCHDNQIAVSIMEGAIKTETGDVEEYTVGITNYSDSEGEDEMFHNAKVDSGSEFNDTLGNKYGKMQSVELMGVCPVQSELRDQEIVDDSHEGPGQILLPETKCGVQH
jgi:uncharacterized Zn-finger protein